jgi:lipoyl-dependent peroxiredoxin
MIRKAQVVWRGSTCAGTSVISTRLDTGKERSPAELLAAAHAGCFTAALASSLQVAGYSPTQLSAEAAVTQEPDGTGFRISCSALRLRAKVPNLTAATFETLAWHALNNCPISKVLRTQIKLDARLL